MARKIISRQHCFVKLRFTRLYTIPIRRFFNFNNPLSNIFSKSVAILRVKSKPNRFPHTVKPSCIQIGGHRCIGVLFVYDEFKSAAPSATSHTWYVRTNRASEAGSGSANPPWSFYLFPFGRTPIFQQQRAILFPWSVRRLYAVARTYHREVSAEEPLWLTVLIVVRQLFPGSSCLYIPDLSVSISRDRVVEYKSCRIDPRGGLARPFVLVSGREQRCPLIAICLRASGTAR